jgi:hypothetical protein
LLYPDVEQRGRILDLIGDFRAKRGPFNASHLAWQLAGPKMKISALEWWRTNFVEGEGHHLRSLALRILSVPASSASSERNWSTFGYIQDKKRNRLTPERCVKLVFLYWNLRLINTNLNSRMAEGQEDDRSNIENEISEIPVTDHVYITRFFRWLDRKQN